MRFLWERRRPWGVREVGGLLGLLILLDYDLGSAMASGILPLVQNYGTPW